MTSSNIGLHKTTITVSDSAGAYDKQDVKIFVGECTQDSDCTQTDFFCVTNQINQRKWNCHSVVNTVTGIYGLCDKNIGDVTPGNTCSGKESSICVDGFPLCQDKCGDDGDYDGDGYKGCDDSDCSSNPLCFPP